MINGIVYDIEIIRGIPGKGEDPIEGIEYCAGWHDHANMGVSVIGVYDFVDDRFRAFCQDNFDEFSELAKSRKFLITFNGVGFDDKTLQYHVSIPGVNYYPEENAGFDRYDLLREIWISLGYNPDKFYWKTHGGLGLDAMCEANGLGGKTGNGALAPVHWQQGKIGSVIDYCLQDVKLTRDLFLLSQRGPIKNPKGGVLNLRRIINENH